MYPQDQNPLAAKIYNFVFFLRNNPKAAILIIVVPLVFISLMAGIALSQNGKKSGNNVGLTETEEGRGSADPGTVSLGNAITAVANQVNGTPDSTLTSSGSSFGTPSGGTSSSSGQTDPSDSSRGNSGSDDSAVQVPPVPNEDPDIDVCPNRAGIQTTVPADLIKDASGNCVSPPSNDVCPNIPDVQTSIPAGQTKDAAGNCVSPAQDLCKNIDGPQTTVPPGYIKDANGNCIKDMCLNIPDLQATVPPGYSRDSKGNCAAIPAIKVTKILVVVIENHSFTSMKNGMPYTWAAGQQYGYASNYYGIRHPSLPNYLAIAGGSTFGVSDDGLAAAHKLRGASVFGQALARGKTAKLYAETMSGNCIGDKNGLYATKHNPWAYFVDERAKCKLYDVPFTAFRGDALANRLPNVGMVVPNQCNDAHNGGSCNLGRADRWFRDNVMAVVGQSDDWKSGRLAVVLTADEDHKDQGNKVLTVVLTKALYNKHKVVTTRLNHYSLSRLYSQVVGTPGLRNAQSATDMRAAFGLPF